MGKLIQLGQLAYKERTHYQRRCDKCHGTYHRCNKTRTWVRQNPGSRTGWVLAIYTVCVPKCENQVTSIRKMIVREAEIKK